MKKTKWLIALITALALWASMVPVAWPEESPETDLPEVETAWMEDEVEEVEMDLGDPEETDAPDAVDTPDILPLDDGDDALPGDDGDELLPGDDADDIPPEDEADDALPEPEPLALEGAEAEETALDRGPIALNVAEIVLGVGDKTTLEAALTEPMETAPGFTFESSDKAVATVSAAGVVTAKAVGEAEIVVSAGGDLRATCPVKVVKAPTAVKLSPAAVTVALDAERGVYSQARLNAVVSPAETRTALKYSGYNTSILKVTADGALVPLKTGVTYVRVQTYNNRYAFCTVTVKAAPQSLSLSAAALTLQERQSARLKVTLPKNTAGDVTFESLNPEIAAVDAATGAVTGLRPGEAEIAARCFNGVEARCAVTVVPGPDAVTLGAGEVRLGVGDKLTLTAEAVRDDGAEVSQEIAFSVDKKNVATVSASGVVTAKYAGTAKITAAAPNGASAVCAVTVVAAPVALKLNAKSMTLGLDAARGIFSTGTLTATLSPASSVSAIRYSGYDPAIVDVLDDGTVVPVGPGKTTVKASTYNGRTASCTVTVQAAPDAIGMDKSALTLLERQSGQVKALLPEGTAGKITYTIDRPECAEVNPDTGAVTALCVGEAVITATCFNGVTAACTLTVLPGPDRVTLSETQRTLGVGDRFTLIAAPERDDGQATSPEVAFSVDKKNVATVSASGVVTAKYTGTAKITAAAPNGVKAVCTVKVVPAPWSVKLNRSKVTLALDAARGAYTTFRLTAALSPANSASGIRYTGYDPTVVDVLEDGTVVPVGIGTTTVKAVTCNNRSASCAVTVAPAPETLEISPGALTLLEHQTASVKAVLPAGAAGSVRYDCDDPECVAVDPDTGAVTALRMGEAVITATCFNGVAASCSVSVLPGPDRIDLSADTYTLGMGDRFTLTATPARDDGQETSPEVVYTTSSKTVATVSASGVVTGKYLGTAKITAKAANGVKATCTVKVVMAPYSIKLSPASLKLSYDSGRDLGTRAQMKAVLSANSASSIRYSVTEGDAVEVTEDGWVIARGVGTATVKAVTCNNRSATCKVTVLPAPESLALEPGTLSLLERQTADLAAVLPDGTAGEITFSSGDPEVADVDPATGRVTALRMGETAITATCFNGVTAVCPVSVLPGPDRVEISTETRKVGVGDRFTLTATPVRDDGMETVDAVEWSSSRAAVATVSAEGVVQGKQTGKATVTAKAANGVKATCAVEVVPAPWSVKLNSTTLTLNYEPEDNICDTFRLTATLSAGSVSEITWSGYDEGIVTVSPDGVVTPVSYGTTKVTASTYNNRKASCTVTVQRPQTAIDHYRDNHPLIAVAHRGGRAYWPENTLEAFRHTKSTGADMIELDVQTTSDGVQVIHHDQAFTADGRSWNIPSYTYAQLKAAKPSLCTLDEALDVIRPTGLSLQLELKTSANAAKCVDAIARHGMKDRTWYISFYKARLTEVRALDAGARLGYIFSGSVPSGLSGIVSQLRLSALMVHQNLLTQARLDDWHRQGLMVNVWTVNDLEKCRRYGEMGVDFITSDYPDYAVAAK